jgi:hypothetical protein
VKPEELSDGEAIGLLAFMFTLGAAIVGIGIWILRRARQSRPGFEVKLNTGEEPVIEKERENDHG